MFFSCNRRLVIVYLGPCCCVSFLKMAYVWPLFHLFSFFCKQILQFCTTRQCEKCPSRIRCWDLNPFPLERKSPQINTGPGLQGWRHSCITILTFPLLFCHSRTFHSFSLGTSTNINILPQCATFSLFPEKFYISRMFFVLIPINSFEVWNRYIIGWTNVNKISNSF